MSAIIWSELLKNLWFRKVRATLVVVVSFSLLFAALLFLLSSSLDWSSEIIVHLCLKSGEFGSGSKRFDGPEDGLETFFSLNLNGWFSRQYALVFLEITLCGEYFWSWTCNSIMWCCLSKKNYILLCYYLLALLSTKVDSSIEMRRVHVQVGSKCMGININICTSTSTCTRHPRH